MIGLVDYCPVAVRLQIKLNVSELLAGKLLNVMPVPCRAATVLAPGQLAPPEELQVSGLSQVRPNTAGSLSTDPSASETPLLTTVIT